MANRGQLMQAFLNIIINAAQAIDEGRADHNRIWIRSGRDGDGAVVEIGDSGRGIAPELVGRIFEPFYSTKPSSLSSGLGLTVSRGIIEGCGGSIEVRSKVNGGTRVLVRLPGAPVRKAVARESTPAHAPADSEPRGRVLVVDDDKGVREWVALQLGRRHEVVTASSGTEAAKILQGDAHFDVVLCDLMMGDGAGTDLHAWTKDHAAVLASRFVFMSGGVFTQRTEELVRDLPNALLEKPFSGESLERAITAVLRRAMRH